MRRRLFIGSISILIVLAFLHSLSFGSPLGNDLSTKEKSDPVVIEQTITMALDYFKKGDFEATIAHLAEAMMLVKNNLDLHLTKLIMCTEVRDYRDFDGKDSFEIQAGEPLLLYLEPDGYHILKEGDSYKIWVSQDASISSDQGEVIFQRNNWVTYKRTFPTPILPFYMTNRVSDIPAGKYTYSLTLKDHYKNTFFSHAFDFVVK